LALQKILIIACPSQANNTGKVTILIRETLKLGGEFVGDYKE